MLSALARRLLVAVISVLALVASPSLASGAGAQAAPQGMPTRGGPAPVLGSGDRAAIPDRYIVVFRKDASRSTVRSAMTGARTRGATVHHQYTAALKGFSATLSRAALDNLRRNPNVAYIEADRRVSISATQTPATWGIDRIDQRYLPLDNSYTYNHTGAGVTAYVIDTGIRISHSEFGGRASHGYDAIDGGTADDCNGHGTHVAGTIGGSTYGVAKNVNLVAVRVLDCSGSGSWAGVIAGVDWVTNNSPGPAVANMSLGGGASTAVDNAVANSIASGVTYAIAAGNSYRANACNYSPARVASAITVGATNSSDMAADYTNIGSCLDLFAPGSDITSAWHTSDFATHTISGTSMATPHVAGVAALYLETNPSASPATVRDTIVANATPGVVGNPGAGSPNLLLYSLLGSSPPPPPSACTYPEVYSGTLLGTGDYHFHPGGTYYYSGVYGTHRGCVEGPSGTDYDLYLYKWTGSYWAVVAWGESPTSVENVSYYGSPGYYLWEVYSYYGAGPYTFTMQRA